MDAKSDSAHTVPVHSSVSAASGAWHGIGRDRAQRVDRNAMGTAESREEARKRRQREKLLLMLRACAASDIGGSPSDALRVLREADTTLQAVLVEDGMLPLVVRLLKEKTSSEAATRLLEGLDDCFEDMIAAAKSAA